MTTWTALFKKDFRLTRTVFFVGLIINFLFLMLALYVEVNTGDDLYLFIPLLVAIGFHVFYLPIVLFISLKSEANQLHLWLHNPQSAVTLLLSKVLNGIVMMFVSLAVLYAMMGWLIISRFQLVEAYWKDTWTAGLLIFPHMIMISMMIGVWVLLLWSLYHALKYRIGRWTWIILLGAVILTNWLEDVLLSTKLFKFITEWGGSELNFPTFSIDPIPLHMGEYLYHFIYIIGLFILSAWLINRKVEV